MRIDEYSALDGLGLAALIRSGQITVLEAAAAAGAAAAAREAVGAIAEVFADRLDGTPASASGLGGGPFHGVPFLLKDVGLHLAGRKAEFASRLMKGDIAPVSSTLGTLFQAAGLNIIGRSKAPEFSIASTTETALYGATHNPWRPGFSAGGSSGGGMAAVMAGIVPLAHGSDIAGSIRIPASWCGGLGLKPSRGRISAGPMRDEGGWGLAMNFVQSKSLRDTAAMLDALWQPQCGDPFVIPPPAAPYADLLRQPALAPTGERLRIGITTTPVMAAPVDPEIVAAVEAAGRALEAQGHVIVPVTPDFDALEAVRTLVDVWFFGFDQLLDDAAQRLHRTIGPDTLEPVTLMIYEHARRITPRGFMAGMTYLNIARRRLARLFDGCDAWLTPTTAQVAEPLGTYHQGRTDVSLMAWVERGTAPIQFCFPHNVMGTPAISLPLATHSCGLPIGVQIGARPAREDHVLQLAYALLGDRVLTVAPRTAP